jgi:hypothetical protein
VTERQSDDGDDGDDGDDAAEHPTRRRLASEDGWHEVMRSQTVAARAAL